ncbi:MAG: peptidylprolyl isomerase [Gemmataceae bacterium]|nr:peptidylprolyl isomerase [Gemmataceae bacterium]
MRELSVGRPAIWGWLRGLVAVASLGAGAFGLGWLVAHHVAPNRATAGQLPAAPPAASSAPVANDAGYANREVAYINGNVPITREDLGEYLIERFGAEKLELLVNKKIIDRACEEKKIQVTAAEIELALEEDLKGINVTRQQFLDNVLKHYRKTLYEWKEDVLRPRIQLTKLCRDRVRVEDDDIRKAFESKYGEKVDVRILTFSNAPGKERIVLQVYEKIRESDEEFDRAVRSQENGALAAADGHVKPISRHTSTPEVERTAFSLRAGDISPVVRTDQGFLIMKCLGRIPADTTKKIEDEKDVLYKEMLDKKIQAAIPIYFKELRAKAEPRFFMKTTEKQEDVVRDSQKLYNETGDMISPASHKVPGGK